jgi:hypothetical protein
MTNPIAKHKTANLIFLILLSSLAILAIAVHYWDIFNAWKLNVAATRYLVGELNYPQSQSNIKELMSVNCDAAWILFRMSDRFIENETRDLAITKIITCSASYIEPLHDLLPDDSKSASLAVAVQPKSPYAWFWLADSMTHFSEGRTRPNVESDREKIISYYEIGLKLFDEHPIERYLYHPYAGGRWLELGDLWREIDMKAAINAYLQSCKNGDPHYNGCYRAGFAAEEMGDIASAIRYYRLSKWDVAHEKADKLEAQATGTPIP